jgi:hypothetical protein
MPGHRKTKNRSQDKETQRGCHINSIFNNDYYINIQSVEKSATILQRSGMEKSVLCEVFLKNTQSAGDGCDTEKSGTGTGQ